MTNNFGVTLIELLVIIGILVVLTAMAIPTFLFFQKESDLNNSAEEIINVLRLAQNKTLASEEASQWGVYFTTSTSPHQYVLFKGADYDFRDTSFDQVHKLPKSIEIYELNFEDNATSSIVFERVTGTSAAPTQSVSLRLKTDTSKTKTIDIESSGQVGLE